MRKFKKLRIKHQETKRRVQFVMHMGAALEQTHRAQTVIPEVERHQFEKVPEHEDYPDKTIA